jgi:NACHT domain
MSWSEPPGSGKTTFLRHLVLDMLSDSPALTMWARRLGGRLPVWLPFHFFTWRQARYRGANASLAATLQAWLEQHDAAGLWPLVEVALKDERLLLIVDGLDEWVSESAGRSALAGLETFLGTREVPADTARHAIAVLDAIETHSHIAHRQRLLAASVAGLSNPAGRSLRERLSRWTLAPHPLPPALFHHLAAPSATPNWASLSGQPWSRSWLWKTRRARPA